MKKKLRKKLKRKKKLRGNVSKVQRPQQQKFQAQTPEQVASAAGLSPEVRQQFDIFVSNAISIIHDPKVSQSIIQKLKANPDIVEAAATTTVDIVRRLENSAKTNGVKINLAVIAQGGNIILHEILLLGETANIPPLSNQDKFKAYSLAVALYINQAVKNGEITPQELQQWANDAKKTKQGQMILQKIQEMGNGQPGAGTEQQPPVGAAPAPGQGNPQGGSPQGGQMPPNQPPGLLQNQGGM